MIHDSLIANVLERAEDCFWNGEVLKASNIYERAFRRIFLTVEEENMKSIKDYTSKYEFDFAMSEIVYNYLNCLNDIFEENGDKSFLEKIIQFKEKYTYLFESDEEVYIVILKKEADALFYLGNEKVAFEKYEKLIEKAPNVDTNYFDFSRLCYEFGELERAIEVLKRGIKNCEFGLEFLEDRLEMYEEELSSKK